MSYVVFAEISVKPESFADAKAMVSAILPATRDEAGCEVFLLHETSDRPDTLFIYERWTDRAAFDFHHARPYTLDVYRSYEGWLAAPVKITVLNDID